jgi:hypothetical protein
VTPETLKCPVCKADNSSGPNCRRCKADLAMMWTLEGARTHHIKLARSAAEENDLELALEKLANARELRSGPDLVKLRACVCLLAGDFESAFAEYRLATQAKV